MQESIDKSKVSRDNILNNELAINEVQAHINVPGVVIDDEYYITTRQVAVYLALLQEL